MKISILIPCYNSELWIEKAILSSLNQTYQNCEIIVVDDGSLDLSYNIIRRFGNQIKHECVKHGGANRARNRLLSLSSGNWVQYLDADDYLLPDKIERQVEFIKQNANADVVYGPSLIENSDTGEKQLLPIPEPHDVWVLLARWFLPQTGASLFRKQALLDVGCWNENQPCCQEHELYLRLAKFGKKFELLDYAGSVYRNWSETTLSKINKQETILRRLEVVDQLECHLMSSDQLTPLRRQAINIARFECARMVWSANRNWARSIIDTIKSSDAKFIPTGRAAPLTYRFIYQLLGFDTCEYAASGKRIFAKLFCNQDRQALFKN